MDPALLDEHLPMRSRLLSNIGRVNLPRHTAATLSSSAFVTCELRKGREQRQLHLSCSMFIACSVASESCPLRECSHRAS